MVSARPATAWWQNPVSKRGVRIDRREKSQSWVRLLRIQGVLAVVVKVK